MYFNTNTLPKPSYVKKYLEERKNARQRHESKVHYVTLESTKEEQYKVFEKLIELGWKPYPEIEHKWFEFYESILRKGPDCYLFFYLDEKGFMGFWFKERKEYSNKECIRPKDVYGEHNTRNGHDADFYVIPIKQYNFFKSISEKKDRFS